MEGAVDSSPQPVVRHCASCAAKDAQLKCSACGFAYYCDKVCQRNHWATRKALCKARRQMTPVEGKYSSELYNKAGNVVAQIVMRQAKLPSVGNWHEKRLPALVEAMNSADITIKLLKYLRPFDIVKPLPKSALKEVKQFLIDGAGPNAVAYLYPAGGDPNGVFFKETSDKSKWMVSYNCMQVCHSSVGLGPSKAEAILRLLAKHGADLNCVDEKGDTFLGMLLEPLPAYDPYSDAVFPTTERLLKTALELGANPDLPAAAPSPPHGTVDQMLRGLTPDHDNEGNENRKLVKRMLRVLQILKDAGANLKPEEGMVSVPSPASRSHSGPANQTTTYLARIVAQDCGPLVKWVLDNTGADVNVFCDGFTPTYLFHAARTGSPEAARLLLEAGIDPTVTDNTGHTALDSAESMAKHSFDDVMAEMARVTGMQSGAAASMARMMGRGRHKECAEIIRAGVEAWRAKHSGREAVGPVRQRWGLGWPLARG